MKKNLHLLRLFSIFVFSILLINNLNAKDYKKYWTEGKLSWDDFQERVSNNDASELKYYLGYNSDTQKLNDTIITRIITTAYIDRELSWINPEYKNEQYLKYNQVLFDIVELYRRKLQYSLDRLKSSNDVENKFNLIYKKCTDYAEQFRSESDYGRNEKMVLLWEQKIAQELEYINDKNIPPFTKSNFGLGLFAGLGTSLFTGSLGETFSPTFNLAFGFEFAYKNSKIFINTTLGSNSVRKNLQSDPNWYSGQLSKYLTTDISYGYCLINTDKIKLTPYIGLCATEFTADNKVKDKPEINIVDYNVLIGLYAEYKYLKRINLIPDPVFEITDYSEICIHTGVYLTRASFAEDLKGYSINLKVGMSLFGTSTKLN